MPYDATHFTSLNGTDIDPQESRVETRAFPRPLDTVPLRKRIACATELCREGLFLV